MKWSKWLCPLAALTLMTSNIYGQDGKTPFQADLEETDMEILHDFISGKRKIPLKDKINKLKISGELHTEWNFYTEHINGKNVRVFVFDQAETINDDVFTPGERILIAQNDFDIQADLFFDWDIDKTWARMHLRFDNSAGVDDNDEDPAIDAGGYHGSGSCNKVCLKEAYVGYEIFKCNNRRMIVEIGRRPNIYKLFYSEVEFKSRFDGIFLKYSSQIRDFSDWYVQWGGLVVDERANHYAWVAEVALDNIQKSGLNVRYSFVEWTKFGRNRYLIQHPEGFRFKVSQVYFIWNMMPKNLGQPLELFGGYLVNHTPSGKTFVNINPTPGGYTAAPKHIGKDHNHGGFLGFQYRDIHKEGDWLFRAMMAFCEAQCIPDNDVRNIGTGNFEDDSFTSKGRGNVNWKGYAFKLGYAVTNNWVFELGYDHSWSIDNHIAGTHRYTRFLLESTYCW